MVVTFVEKYVAKPRYPPLPSHGFGTRPVKRSRHGTRVTKVNGGYQGRRIFLSRDSKRRILYFAGLFNNRPHLVQSYLSKLAPKTLLRMIKYIGRQGVPRNVQQAFNIVRKQFLKPFPSTEVEKRTFPKLIIMGYTREMANVVRLRGLLMRPNILSHIPHTCQAFR